MNEMIKKRKFQLVGMSIAILSILILAMFSQLHSSTSKIFAKSPISLTTVEEELYANEVFHIKISDTRAENELKKSDESSPSTDLGESKKDWQIRLPEGIEFNEAEERAMLLQEDPKAAFPVFNWNEETRMLTITVNSTQSSLKLALLAEQSGDYSLTLTDEANNVGQGELKVVVKESKENKDNSQAPANLDLAQPRALSSRAAGTAEVTDWQSFVEAIADNTVNTISIQNDITLSGTLNNYKDLFSVSSVDLTSAQNVYLYINKNATARSLTIDGNGHNFNFGNLAIGFLNQTSYVSGSSGTIFGYWNLKFQNINMSSSNYSGPFYISSYTATESATNGLTDTIRSNANISYDLTSATNTRNVTDFLGYTIGLNDPWVTNVELLNDIYTTAPTYSSSYFIYSPYLRYSQNVTSTTSIGIASGGESHMYFQLQGNARTVKVNGNNYTLDFGSLCFSFLVYNNLGSKEWDIQFSNMTVYHGNYWGAMIFNNGANGGKMTMDNYTGYGTQFLESQQTNLTLKNKVHLEQQRTWTSVRKDGTTIRTWNVNNYQQGSLAISTAVVEDNADVYISSLGSNVLYMPSGSFAIGKNVKLKLERGNQTTAAEYYNTNLNISGGSLSVGEGSTVDILNHHATFGGAVYLGSASSELNIGKNATVNIQTDAYSGTGNNDINYNPIYMNGGSINVSGNLNVKGVNMGASTTDLFYVANNSTFIVQPNASFDIQSDSTSITQYLLRMGGASSTFKFSDAKRVNLQKNKALTSGTTTNNGLIWSQGNLDVSVQNVFQWSLNNVAGGADGDNGYTYEYIPMSNMRLAYGSGFNPTITASNAMTNETLTRFNANFTTRGQQRVLFTRVPDPNIAIHSIATDNRGNNSSTTVSGYAIPNAYIRIWDVPVNNSITAAFDPSTDSVKSPVEDTSTPAEYRANFTTKSDAAGNWSVTVPAGHYFTAGSVIHAYGFANLKAEEVTQTVLDKTPPTASPVTYYMTKGDPLPAAKDMVKEVSDTSPVNTGFDYAYTDPTTAETAANTPGTHTVKINVSDKAVDADGNPAPNTKVVESTLVVYDQASGVSGSDFDASYVDIRNLSETELKNYILQHSKPEAYKLTNGIKTDLTQFVTVTDFGGLNNVSQLQPKAYTVTLAVKAADSGLPTDITTTIQVTVVDVDAVLSVEFLNEANQVLPGYTVKLNTQVGDTIDLTKEESVTTQLTNLTKAGYDIAERPANETAVKINNTALTVQYKLQGVLSLTSVPSALDFGSLAYNATTKRVEDPEFDKQLVVTDTRADAANGWRLTATLTTPMKNGSGQELVNALRYVADGKETILNTNAQVVYTNSKGTAGSFDVSDSWGKTANTDGIKLQINSSDTVYTGDYVGVITWKVMAGQP